MVAIDQIRDDILDGTHSDHTVAQEEIHRQVSAIRNFWQLFSDDEVECHLSEKESDGDLKSIV
jgi:hypothetical protein